MWLNIRTAAGLGVLALSTVMSSALQMVDEVGALNILADVSEAPT